VNSELTMKKLQDKRMDSACCRSVPWKHMTEKAAGDRLDLRPDLGRQRDRTFPPGHRVRGFAAESRPAEAVGLTCLTPSL
jgi:hypothetical protein